MDQRRIMVDTIEALVNKRDYVLFPDIEKEVPGFICSNDHIYAIGSPHSLLWGASEMGAEAFYSVLSEQRVCLSPHNKMDYLVACSHITFLRDPDWLPFSLRPKKFSNFTNPHTHWLFCLGSQQLAMARKTIKNKTR